MYVLSKIAGFFVVPSNLLILIGIVGVLLLCTRFTGGGRRFLVTSVVLLAIGGLSPLGNSLIFPLEQRFPAWDASHGSARRHCRAWRGGYRRYRGCTP
jgi:hypothetical protein